MSLYYRKLGDMNIMSLNFSKLNDIKFMSLNSSKLNDIKFMSPIYSILSDIKFMSLNQKILSDIKFISPNVRKSDTILECYNFAWSYKLPLVFDIFYRLINFPQEINENCQKNKRENQKIT